MADVPHLLKNLRNHLTKGQLIYLPEEIVKKHDWPTNCVNIEFIRAPVRHDEKDDLKLAPHLNASVLDPNHYDEMKVGLGFFTFSQ